MTTELSTTVQADAVQIQGSRWLQKWQSKYSKKQQQQKLIKDHLHTTGQSEVLCPCQIGSVTMDHLLCTRPPWHNWPVKCSVPLPDWQRDKGPSAACMPTYTTSPDISSGQHRLWWGESFSSALKTCSAWLPWCRKLVLPVGISTKDHLKKFFIKPFLADFRVNKPQTKGLTFFKTTTAWFF